jgi:hypothetical protein
MRSGGKRVGSGCLGMSVAAQTSTIAVNGRRRPVGKAKRIGRCSPTNRRDHSAELLSLSGPQETFTTGPKTGRMGWEMVVERATRYWIISGLNAAGQLDPAARLG